MLDLSGAINLKQVERVDFNKLTQAKTPNHADLKFDGLDQAIRLKVAKDQKGELMIDGSSLYPKSGLRFGDSGYTSVAAVQSKKTFIDGKNGILEHAGYRIGDLAERSNFPEVMYLLLNDELPNAQQLASFNKELKTQDPIPAGLKEVINQLPAESAHPMQILAAAVNYLGSFNSDTLKPGEKNDITQIQKDSMKLLNNLPTIVAMIYQAKHKGKHPSSVKTEFSLPDQKSYTARFLHAMFGEHMSNNPKLDPKLAEEIFDKLFILHADHEQNCSTSTVRMISSSKANTYAAIAGGINALSGPSHGMANQDVLENLRAIQKEAGPNLENLDKALDKQIANAKLPPKDRILIPGIGHRVYKNTDPRATAIKGLAGKLFEQIGTDDPLLKIAKKLEERVNADEKMKADGNKPNVDFYSGILYQALGLPEDMFTTMFAVGRLPGWLAHMQEQRSSGFKIDRPRQFFTGHSEKRDYVDIEERAA